MKECCVPFDEFHDRLEKELREERSKLNTIKGEIKEVQADRKKVYLQYQSNAGEECPNPTIYFLCVLIYKFSLGCHLRLADKKKESDLTLRKLNDKIENKSIEERHMRLTIEKVSNLLMQSAIVNLLVIRY